MEVSPERKKKKPRKKEKCGAAEKSEISLDPITCPHCGLEDQLSPHISNCAFKPPPGLLSTSSPLILLMNLSRAPDWCPYESLRLCLQSSTTCRGVYPLIFTPEETQECPAMMFFRNIGAVNDYEVLEEMVLASAGGQILLPKRGKIHAMDSSFEAAAWADFSHLTKPRGKFEVEDFGVMWKVSMKKGSCFERGGESLEEGVVIKEEK